MKTASAPSQLPFAPRPISNELFSSWLLRVAGANCVSLRELLLGFQSSYPNIPCSSSLDLRFAPAFLKAMTRFCRTPIRRLQSLDLQSRLPQAERALLLRFSSVSNRCSRLRDQRIGYAFCPTCISQQRSVHVRWEWAFPCLLRCHVHRSLLKYGCPKCGEHDPLPLGAAPATEPILCWACGADLANDTNTSHVSRVGDGLAVFEKTYRAALLGVPPNSALLGQGTDRQFRRFVDDIFQMLAWYPNPQLSPRSSSPQNLYLPFRGELLAIIGDLILNASPSFDPQIRRARYHKSLRLWGEVLILLSQRDGELIESASELWPPALRRHLDSALLRHSRNRSQYSPFRSPFFRPGLKYINSFEFRDFSAVNQAD